MSTKSRSELPNDGNALLHSTELSGSRQCARASQRPSYVLADIENDRWTEHTLARQQAADGNGTKASAGCRVPPRVQGEVERILNGAARRLLDEKLNGDTVSATAGIDGSLLDGSPNQSTALIEGEPIPVRVGTHA
jgi:hypothetical protein